MARLYASTYPEDVVGMVLLDSTHEDVWHRFQQALTPAQWKEFEAQTVTNQELLDAYPESEQWWTAPLPDTPSVIQVRDARRAAPLRPMPLVVLAHGIPFPAPFPGWPTDKMEGIMFALQQDVATLVPDARLIVATESAAQHPPGSAGAGDRRDPAGGHCRARPVYVELISLGCEPCRSTEVPRSRGHLHTDRMIRLSEDEAWDVLDKSHTGILTTLRRDGMPVSNMASPD